MIINIDIWDTGLTQRLINSDRQRRAVARFISDLILRLRVRVVQQSIKGLMLAEQHTIDKK